LLAVRWPPAWTLAAGSELELELEPEPEPDEGVVVTGVVAGGVPAGGVVPDDAPAAETTAVASELDDAVPAALLAVTLTRTVSPTAAEGTVKVEEVEAAVALHVAPAPSHSFHWYV
jgi:hypothetical protein